MAQDAFNPEIPQPLRDLMKMSIEQARRAFETFASTTERTWKSLENSSESARASLHAFNAKIADITRRNADAQFALAMKLAESKDVNQAMSLQGEHMRKQMENFVQQLEEMRDLTTQIIQEAGAATGAESSAGKSASSVSSARSGGGYAPSSAYSPGETGRTY
jgi:phasin